MQDSLYCSSFQIARNFESNASAKCLESGLKTGVARFAGPRRTLVAEDKIHIREGRRRSFVGERHVLNHTNTAEL